MLNIVAAQGQKVSLKVSSGREVTAISITLTTVASAPRYRMSDGVITSQRRS